MPQLQRAFWRVSKDKRSTWTLTLGRETPEAPWHRHPEATRKTATDLRLWCNVVNHVEPFFRRSLCIFVQSISKNEATNCTDVIAQNLSDDVLKKIIDSNVGTWVVSAMFQQLPTVAKAKNVNMLGCFFYIIFFVSVMTFLSNMSNWRHWMKMSSGWLYKPELRRVTIQQPSVESTVRLQKCYIYMLILLGVQGRITTWLIDFRIVCSGCFDPRSRAKGGGEWGENDVMSWQNNSPAQHGFGAAWENCKLFSIILSTI